MLSGFLHPLKNLLLSPTDLVQSLDIRRILAPPASREKTRPRLPPPPRRAAAAPHARRRRRRGPRGPRGGRSAAAAAAALRPAGDPPAGGGRNGLTSVDGPEKVTEEKKQRLPLKWSFQKVWSPGFSGSKRWICSGERTNCSGEQVPSCAETSNPTCSEEMHGVASSILAKCCGHVLSMIPLGRNHLTTIIQLTSMLRQCEQHPFKGDESTATSCQTSILRKKKRRYGSQVPAWDGMWLEQCF